MVSVVCYHKETSSVLQRVLILCSSAHSALYMSVVLVDYVLNGKDAILYKASSRLLEALLSCE